MASGKPQKTHPSTLHIVQKPKRRMNSSALQPIPDLEGSAEETRNLVRLNRQLSTDLSSHSPYAVPQALSLPRSKSVCRVKVRAGKPAAPGKRLDRQRTELLKEETESRTRKRLQSSLALSFYSLPSEDSPRRDEASKIHEDLVKRLEAQGEDWRGELQACSQALKELATLDSAFTIVLDKVRSTYDARAQALSDQMDGNRISLSALQAKFAKETEEKEAFKGKLELISRENVELSQTCEAYQARCFEYQEKLFDVACVRLDAFPPAEKTWRLVLSELEAYKAWKSSALSELKAAKSRETKLVTLIHALKKRGIPVEEIYATDVRKRQKSARSCPSDSSSEAEPLASGPPLVYSRPGLVPALSLQGLEPESSSEESSQPSSTGLPYKTLSNSSTDSQVPSSRRVPQLELPVAGGPDFQEEFMQKYEEFSQSWKEQIGAMHQ